MDISKSQPLNSHNLESTCNSNCYATTDAAIGSSLKLIVKETVKPVITLIYPTDGTYTQNNSTSITFTVTDEANGSGLKENSISLKIDGIISDFVKESIPNGFNCIYTPLAPLNDGQHTIEIDAQDNDGNWAAKINAVYTIDTIPPTLSVTEPTFSITNQPSCTFSGTTNDNLSTPVSVEFILNGESTGNAEVDSDGNFSKTLTLSEGDNVIKVISTDKSGRSTTVTKTIKLDTSIPQITNAHFEPNPTSVSHPVKITLEVI